MKRILTVCSLLFAFAVQAATWYVGTTASGNGSGDSWANKRPSFPQVGDASVGPGDTVYFDGGSSGLSYSIGGITPERGTSGNPVTYRPGQDAGHNGIVTFNASGDQLFNGDLSYITFNGTNNDGTRHFVMNGNWIAYCDTTAALQFRLLNVTFNGQIWLRGTEHELGWCVGQSPLHYNAEDSMINHIGEWPAPQAWGLSSIHHNTFTLWRNKSQGYGWDCLKHIASTDVVSNNFISVYSAAYTGTQHSDAIQSNGGQLNVVANYFENWLSYVWLKEITEGGSDGHERFINNVMFYSNESGVDWGAQCGIAWGGNSGTPAGTLIDCVVANNTLIDQAVGNGTPLRGYAVCDTYPGINPQAGASVTIANNHGSVLQRNPLTLPIIANNTDSGGIVVNAALYPNGNFRWAGNSSATIDQGVFPTPNYLSTNYTTDADGNTRSGHWDIGAYEYNSGAPDTTPPTIRSNTIAASGQTIAVHLSEGVQFGAGGNGGFALSIANCTLTYSSGAGGTILNYTTSRVITNSESITLAYTQPGNGVEDLAGNDLASFSGTNVTNNSQQPDLTAPTPDPLTFATDPAAIDSAYISCTASTVTDLSNPVGYQAEVTRAGTTTNTAYQATASFTFGPFPAQTTIAVRVRARDAAGTPNVTGWSASKQATTTIVTPAFKAQVGSAFANSTSTSFAVPGTTTLNDVVLFLKYFENWTSFTNPANEGFTAFAVFTNSAVGKTSYYYAAWKREDSSPPSAYTWTHGATDGYGRLLVFSGCATTISPFNIPPTWSARTTDANTYPSVSITTSNASTLCIWLGAIFEQISGITFPSGYTNAVSFGSGNNPWVMGYKPRSTSGSETASGATYVGTAGPATAVLFALQPEPFADQVAPVVTITSPTSSPTISVADASVTLSGTSVDAFGTQAVNYALTGDTTDSGSCQGTSSWSVTFSVGLGVTTCTITGTDAAGNSGQDVLTITRSAVTGLTIQATTVGASNVFIR